jgi:hypothetical protein
MRIWTVFLHNQGAEEEEEKSKKVVRALYKVLRSCLLKRVKCESDVEKNLFLSTSSFFLKLSSHH